MMRREGFAAALVVAIGAHGFGVSGCGTFEAADSPPDGGPAVDTTGGDAEVDAGQVVTEPPSDDEITEAFGVFVSLQGTDDGDGSRARPFSTIGAGIAKAAESGRRVYVCKGSYKESLVLRSGVSVSGGFICGTTWAIDPEGRSSVEATSNPAITATDISIATRFEGIDVQAAPGSAEQPSSMGLLAVRAPKLAVVRSRIVAGRALDGSAGSDPSDAAPGGQGSPAAPSFTAPRSTPLSRPPGAAAGAPPVCGSQPGGAGGHRGVYQSGTDCTIVNAQFQCPLSIVPPVMVSQALVYRYDPIAPQIVAEGGKRGAPGTNGAHAAQLGTFSPAGYAPAAAQEGGAGGIGVAGSGGAGVAEVSSVTTSNTYFFFGGGSGGGSGGCPGQPGTVGTGGFASVGALLFDSAGLTFDTAEVVGGQGGTGGQGTLGGKPGAGGPAGVATSGTPGQAGGAGGRAGYSGSGAGGPSFGVAHKGGAPVLTNGSVGKAGTPGAGAAALSKDMVGVVAEMPASPAGLAQPMFELP